jgi:hypothetical protein
MEKGSSLKPNSNTTECNRPWHHRIAAGVIAQQYSSTTLLSSCFQTRKKKPVRFTLNVIISFYLTLFNIA